MPRWSRFARRLRCRSKSAPPALLRRSNKRKLWTNIQMLTALKAVEEGQPVNQIARDHGTPKTTLKDHVSGKVTHGTNPGPTPYLSIVEDELGNFLKSCAEVGYGKTRRDAMGIAESIAVDKRVLKGENISVGWWRRFLERQPNLTLRRGGSTAHVQLDAVYPETMDQYFRLLGEVLMEHNLVDKPLQIYNVDESGVPPVSKYLVLPTPLTPTGPKTLPRSRLLTSAECLAQLEEKECQKQLAAQEKEQRKKE